MTPLPALLGGTELVAWRLDTAKHAAGWDSGAGAFRLGGRWNSKGVKAVYCSLDPATAVLEVAVHKGFSTLDTVSHVLTACAVVDPAAVHVVDPAMIPNPSRLQAGIPSAGQQAIGDGHLRQHKFIVLPSVVSTHSWNLVFTADAAAGDYTVRLQERFALDPRLHPPT